MAQSVTREASPDNTCAVPPRMSYEAFLNWADGRHAEWVAGEVILIMSPASRRHQLLVQFLVAVLTEWGEAHDLGIVLSAPFQMKLNTVSSGSEPDVLFVAQEHLDRLTPTYLNGPADIVIEIISSESREQDEVTKLREYAQGGVREYWLLDPEREEVTFYVQSAGGGYQAGAIDPEGIYYSPLLAGLGLRIAWLWQDPLPTLRTVRNVLSLL